MERAYVEREKVRAQLEALQLFPNTMTVRQLRREVKEKLQRIEQRIATLERKENAENIGRNESEDRQHDREFANLKRSRFMKNRHRLVRLVHAKVRGTKYEAPYKVISHWIAVRRRGGKIPIPDVILHNLSD